MIYDLFPEIISGDTALEEISHILTRRSAQHPLVVVQGNGRACLRLLSSALRDSPVVPKVVIRSGDRPTLDPAAIVSEYRDSGCDSIISIGNGRIHGAAKLASAMITDPPTGKADTVRPPHCIVTAPVSDGLEVSGTGLPGLPGIRFQSDALRPSAVIIDDRILKTYPERSHIDGACVTLLLIAERLRYLQDDPFTASWLMPALLRLTEALLPDTPADGRRRRAHLSTFRVALTEAAIFAGTAQVMGNAQLTPAAALLQLCIFQHGSSAEASACHLLPSIIDALESGPEEERTVDSIKRLYDRILTLSAARAGSGEISDLQHHPLSQGIPARSSMQDIYSTLISIRSETSVVPEDIRRIFHG